jgi:ABC-type transporter Mla maintaining outer membrane lipid asymmetry permease subunit MlaE
MATPEECVILDIPQGLSLNLLGLIVTIGPIRIVADRAGLLGGILASLTCGGIESAERLEALAQMVRSQSGANGGAQPQQQPAT